MLDKDGLANGLAGRVTSEDARLLAFVRALIARSSRRPGAPESLQTAAESRFGRVEYAPLPSLLRRTLAALQTGQGRRTRVA